MSLTIRSARPNDAERLVALLLAGAAAGATRREDLADLRPYQAALSEIAATQGAELLVAEADGEVVGMCQLITFRHFQEHGGRCAEVESVHVAPEHRSCGIGAALLEAAVERARQAGCYRIQLTSNVSRPDAHRFYQRQGFEPTHVGFKRYLG